MTVEEEEEEREDRDTVGTEDVLGIRLSILGDGSRMLHELKTIYLYKYDLRENRVLPFYFARELKKFSAQHSCSYFILCMHYVGGRNTYRFNYVRSSGNVGITSMYG